MLRCVLQDEKTGNERTGTGELSSMHYEAAFLTAKRLFHAIAPGAPFFPRRDDGDARGGVGGSAYDEGGDWDSVEFDESEGAAAAPAPAPADAEEGAGAASKGTAAAEDSGAN